MAMTAMISVEGVLAKPADNPASARSLHEGRALFEGLLTTMKVALVSSSADRRAVEYWLRAERIRDHATLLTRLPVEDDFDYVTLRDEQLQRLIRDGHNMGLVVDGHPGVIDRARSKGVTGVVFLRPEAVLAKAPMRSWDGIVREVIRRRDKTADADEGERTRTADLP